jgi:hypothetical protein
VLLPVIKPKQAAGLLPAEYEYDHDHEAGDLHALQLQPPDNKQKPAA